MAIRAKLDKGILLTPRQIQKAGKRQKPKQSQSQVHNKKNIVNNSLQHALNLLQFIRQPTTTVSMKFAFVSGFFVLSSVACYLIESIQVFNPLVPTY